MFTKDLLEKLYWQEGKSLAQIGEMYHRDQGAIKRWMILFGIPRRPAGKPNSGKFIKCQICGKDFYVQKARLERDHPKYCGIDCRTIGNRGRYLKKQPKNTSAITKRLRKTIGKCQFCGFDMEPRILTTHHKNINHDDNSPDNLLLLCPNCHSLEHLKQAGKTKSPIVFFGRKRAPYSEWKIKGEYKCKNCGRIFKSPTLRRLYCFECIPVNATKSDYMAMRGKWRTIKEALK